MIEQPANELHVGLCNGGVYYVLETGSLEPLFSDCSSGDVREHCLS